MGMKILIIVLLGSFIAAFGCNAGPPAEQHTANDNRSRPITYPPKSALEYPQDEVVKKEFEVTTQWQTMMAGDARPAIEPTTRPRANMGRPVAGERSQADCLEV